MKNLMTRVVFILLMCLGHQNLLAEDCHMVYGCEEQIGLLRVNKEKNGPELQNDIKKMFGSTLAPAPGSEVILQRSARLRYQLSPESDDRQLERKDHVCKALSCDD